MSSFSQLRLAGALQPIFLRRRHLCYCKGCRVLWPRRQGVCATTWTSCRALGPQDPTQGKSHVWTGPIFPDVEYAVSKILHDGGA